MSLILTHFLLFNHSPPAHEMSSPWSLNRKSTARAAKIERALEDGFPAVAGSTVSNNNNESGVNLSHFPVGSTTRTEPSLAPVSVDFRWPATNESDAVDEQEVDDNLLPRSR